MHWILTSICLLLFASTLVGVASADLSESMSPVTGNVFVSSVTFYPEVFFTGDKGTATYVVMNSNTNTSVMLNHGTFSDDNFKLLSGTYDFSNTLGPLQTRPFTFSILADVPEGDYYPSFSLSFYNSNLYHKTLVQVDNTPLELTVVDKPDAFTQGKKKTITIQVANPRKNDVRNMILEVAGDGITASPSRTFVGDLASGAKIPVNFSVTPDKETPLALTLTYDNGDNPHTVTMNIPVTFGTDKKQADPVMSNVIVKNDGSVYHVTGDVNNAGLDTANTVTVTSLSPAVPQDPYKTYVVGALKADDFGSFEVTFTTDANSTSVPIQLSYRDSDGNIYNSVQNVNIPSTGITAQKSSGLPLVPIIAGLVIVAVFVGGWFVYIRKNKK
ncbi:MAG: hypothetical protein ABSG49_01365 [Methanoregula sp.]